MSEKHNAYMRNWRNRVPGKHAAYMRDWRLRNPEKTKERNRRRRENGVGKKDGLLRRYGISIADRDAMFAGQGGACAICSTKEPTWYRGWVVDHCHETGRVRGILCQTCNIALGAAKDSEIILKKMISYLHRDRGHKIFARLDRKHR